MEAVTKSAGRRHAENYRVVIEDPYLEDFTRILHSRSFRRLADKTQVITAPKNVDVRTRLTHTMEVVAIATTIAEQLGLNIPLCQAIAAGHDVGHAPYGHLGESVLTEILGKKFYHAAGSVIVCQHLEKEHERGLNLSFETLEGISLHSRTGLVELTTEKGKPQEYSAVMFSDKIAYTCSDLNDGMRYRYLNPRKLPKFVKRLGENQDRRTYTLIEALVEESRRKGNVSFSEGEVFEDFSNMRKFLFEEFYRRFDADIKIAILKKIYEFFSREKGLGDVDPAAALLLLTDKEANILGTTITEAGRCRIEDIRGLGIYSSLERIRGKKIDLTKPDLDWKMWHKAI